MVAKLDNSEQFVLEVVEEVAKKEDVSPLDLPPLASAVDPEQITALPEQATLEFPYNGYLVTVDGKQTVRAQKLETSTQNV